MERARPAQAYCDRCKELFVYFRSSRPRLRCAPCIEIVAHKSNREYSRWVSSLKAPEAASANPA